jgi:hypothetical protein
MTGTSRFLALAALLACATPCSLRAQQLDAPRGTAAAWTTVTPADSAAAPSAPRALRELVRGATPGPSLSAASSGLRAPVADRATVADTEPAILARRQRVSQAQALMIVGGATFLAGAIIGDDAGTLIMIGGAGIGIYGLYLYLQ